MPLRKHNNWMQVINLLTLNNVGIIIFVALFLALKSWSSGRFIVSQKGAGNPLFLPISMHILGVKLQWFFCLLQAHYHQQKFTYNRIFRPFLNWTAHSYGVPHWGKTQFLVHQLNLDQNGSFVQSKFGFLARKFKLDSFHYKSNFWTNIELLPQCVV